MWYPDKLPICIPTDRKCAIFVLILHINLKQSLRVNFNTYYFLNQVLAWFLEITLCGCQYV